MKLKYYSGAQVISILEKLPSKEYFEMLDAFAKEPSADVAQVVRCKDCKHLVRSDGVCKVLSNNYEPPVYVDDDDFCSRGERREND